MFTKRVVYKIVGLLSAIMLIISYGSFSVYADTDTDYFYCPNDSIGAYSFWLSMGLDFTKNTSESNSINRSGSYNMVERSYTETANYNKEFHTNNTSSSSTAHYVYFMQGDSTTALTPKYTVSEHNIYVPAYNIEESNRTYSRLSFPSVSGTVPIDTSYNSSHRFQVPSKQYVILSFYSDETLSTGLSFFANNNQDKIVFTPKLTYQVFGSTKRILYTYEFYNSHTSTIYITPVFQFNNGQDREIIPLFLGDKRMLSDDYAQTIGLLTQSEESLVNIQNTNEQILQALNTGTSTTTNKVNNNNNTTDDFNDISNYLHNIEDNSINDMQNQLNNINMNNDLYNNTGFLDGIWFVKAIFNQITTINTEGLPIKLMIMFSLVLGIALTIIGKLRN